MADKVQERLETFVPVLIDFLSKKLFSKREIREIVRRRRDFEYRTISSSCTKNDYLQYIQYEIALETLRKHRCATGVSHSIVLLDALEILVLQVQKLKVLLLYDGLYCCRDGRKNRC